MRGESEHGSRLRGREKGKEGEKMARDKVIYLKDHFNDDIQVYSEALTDTVEVTFDNGDQKATMGFRSAEQLDEFIEALETAREIVFGGNEYDEQ